MRYKRLLRMAPKLLNARKLTNAILCIGEYMARVCTGRTRNDNVRALNQQARRQWIVMVA
jgi:hypothetical protein